MEIVYLHCAPHRIRIKKQARIASSASCHPRGPSPERGRLPSTLATHGQALPSVERLHTGEVIRFGTMLYLTRLVRSPLEFRQSLCWKMKASWGISRQGAYLTIDERIERLKFLNAPYIEQCKKDWEEDRQRFRDLHSHIDAI
jgi:hypothetical protein